MRPWMQLLAAMSLEGDTARGVSSVDAAQIVKGFALMSCVQINVCMHMSRISCYVA